MAKKDAPIRDVMLVAKIDRRLLAHVPDPTKLRSGVDRRDNLQSDESRPQYARYAGQRYSISLRVKISGEGFAPFTARCKDISQTGMLLENAQAGLRPAAF